MTDMFGRVIFEGAWVAKAMRCGNTAEMAVAEVLAVDNGSLVVQRRDRDKPSRWKVLDDMILLGGPEFLL